MRPISTILAFQLMSLVMGYLFAEGCASIRHGRGHRPLPAISTLATHYCWAFILCIAAWVAYALYAEKTFQRRATRDVIPLGLGVAGAVFLFFFFIVAGLATLVQPVRLHG